MKKTLILTMAIAAMVSLGTTEAAPTNLDHTTIKTDSKRVLQDNYLNSLRLRYKSLYNNRKMGREYFNIKTRKAALVKAQKAAHVIGGVKSELSRVGELEQDKERVQEKTPYQVKAVNSKSIFMKRAMDYYVYGGNAGTDAMEAGNINMRDHKVSKRKMLNLMYKHRRDTSDIKLSTREIQKSMHAPEYDFSVKRTSNYRTGDFRSQMLSPFTSLKWME